MTIGAPIRITISGGSPHELAPLSRFLHRRLLATGAEVASPSGPAGEHIDGLELPDTEVVITIEPGR